MKENEFQTFFGKWLRYRFREEISLPKAKNGVCYDLKVVDGLSLAPSKVPEHQIRNLSMGASADGVGTKIADVGVMQKPFDGFMIWGGYCFLGILYKRKEPTERFFCLFDIEKWDGKSVTPDRCDACFAFPSVNSIPTRMTIDQ
jgi:hypothetical protein